MDFSLSETQEELRGLAARILEDRSGLQHLKERDRSDDWYDIPTWQEFAKAKQQFIGSLEASLQNTEGRAREAFGRTVFSEGHPNRPHSIAEGHG